jgi:hypothetical protein
MFVIKLHGGWARNDPLEGWIGTYIISNATQFSTYQQAETVFKDHYSDEALFAVSIANTSTYTGILRCPKLKR